MFTGGVTWLAGQAALAGAGGRTWRRGRATRAFRGCRHRWLSCCGSAFSEEPEARPKDMEAVVASLRGLLPSRRLGRRTRVRSRRPAELLADGAEQPGVSLLDLGRTGGGRKGCLSERSQADPHHLEATYNRGLLLWRSGRMTDDVSGQAVGGGAHDPRGRLAR